MAALDLNLKQPPPSDTTLALRPLSSPWTDSTLRRTPTHNRTDTGVPARLPHVSPEPIPTAQPSVPPPIQMRTGPRSLISQRDAESRTALLRWVHQILTTIESVLTFDQRNYRRKLKRRLEDLERRTTSASASPEQPHIELAQPAPEERHSRPTQSFQRRLSRNHVTASEPTTSPNLFPSEDAWSTQRCRAVSTFPLTSPPIYSYAEYPASSECYNSNYQPATYSHIPTTFAESHYATEYLQTSPTLPTMIASDGMKADTPFGASDMFSPFNMNYASLAGMDMPSTQAYSDYTARVNSTNFFYPYYSYPPGTQGRQYGP